MTTPQPAALPEFIRVLVRVQGGESHSTEAQFMSDDIGYLVCVPREWQPAALQSQPAAAGVSDAEILRAAQLHMGVDAVAEVGTPSIIATVRAILALRPQAVPMTDEQIVAALKACDREDPSKEGWIWRTRIKWARAIEAHHGITAQGAQGEQT